MPDAVDRGPERRRLDCVILAAAVSAAAFAQAAPPTSAAVGTPVAGAVLTDTLFSQPYVDIDEWRGAPVRHRYVHGGFKGTDTRFSFYFPTNAEYRGRFFQHITPTPDSETLAQRDPPGEANKIGFAFASGAYFVETNGGGPASGGFGSKDPTIGAYRANAAAARYSRVVANRIYGGKRPYGYAYGGSGGAFRTVGSFENMRGVWDGVVPYVLGSSMAIPNNFTVRMHAMRLLWDKFPGIVDTMDAGGSGDPYRGLNPEQAAAFREVSAMGFPKQSWSGWKTMGIHGFAALYGGVLMADPTYFTDFWTKPGYLGFDHPESFKDARLQFDSTVAHPITGAEAERDHLGAAIAGHPVTGNVDDSFAAVQREQAAHVVAFRLAAAPPPVDFLGGDLVVASGAAKGARLTVARIVGDVVVLGIVDPAVAAKLATGDAVRIDNSNFLAAQTYHRHQVPGREYAVWNQFRKPDGSPIYPQRPMLLGPLFTKAAAGSLPSGAFDGKMILCESLWDREAFAWSADWYRERVREHFGAATDDHFRLWYTDRALHGDSTDVEDRTRTVSYLGVLQQALRDLSRWVETGTPPPASTRYEVMDGQTMLPATAVERKGIQPVVVATARGAKRIETAVDKAVVIEGKIAVPPGTGSIVAARWDLDGSGVFATPAPVPAGATQAKVRTTTRFARKGIYFVTLQGVSQRDGDAATPYARITNLDRVRIVVR